MDAGLSLSVSDTQALQFFYEHLKDVSDDEPDVPAGELLYNASILAHFATTSTATATTFPPAPTSLDAFFDLFVLDRSRHTDPEILEAAASQCLVLTGFFRDQARGRHNLRWFAAVGAGFFDSASHVAPDQGRQRMMASMARHFDAWRRRQHRLARELRDRPRLV